MDGFYLFIIMSLLFFFGLKTKKTNNASGSGLVTAAGSARVATAAPREMR